MTTSVPGTGEAVTENLLCRRPGANAIDDYRLLFKDPAVESWLRPKPMVPFSPQDLMRMVRRDRSHWETHGYGPWMVREREGGDFVGRGGLAWVPVAGRLTVELPWAVRPELQGLGYATEMARAAIDVAHAVSLDRVVSLTLPDNAASRRVMEKCGMRVCGEIEHVGLPHLLYELIPARRGPGGRAHFVDSGQ